MDRKRIFIDKKSGTKQRIEIVKWAAQHNIDTIVFPLNEMINPKCEYIKLAKKYELNIEAGGYELSVLLPRRLFMFNKDLFRMEQGKRKKKGLFCPTNPKTTKIITEQAKKLFTHAIQFTTEPRVFHLLPDILKPDQKPESIWCSCPACRAFSPAEQNLIAVNCASDVLSKLDAKAKLSYLKIEDSNIAPGVTPRSNMFEFKE